MSSRVGVVLLAALAASLGARSADALQRTASRHHAPRPPVEATRDYSPPEHVPRGVLADPETKAGRRYRDYPYDPGNGYTFPLDRPR